MSSGGSGPASLGQVESGFAEMAVALRGAKAGPWSSMAEQGLALIRHAEQPRMFLAYFPPGQRLVVHTGALSTRLRLRGALGYVRVDASCDSHRPTDHPDQSPGCQLDASPN